MSTGIKLAVIAINQEARLLARRLVDMDLDLDLFVRPSLDLPLDPLYKENKLVEDKASQTISHCFSKYDGLVCIMASGIVVRTIASLLEDKFKDPAILVMDENGEFVISILSGHFGRANELARIIGGHIGASPVITTSTDNKGIVGLDVLAIDNDLYFKDMSQSSLIFNSLLANRGKVALYNAENIKLKDISGYEDLDSLDPFLEEDSYKGLVIISNEKNFHIKTARPIAKLVEKKYILGIGSRKDIGHDQVEEAVERFTDMHNLDPLAIKTLASINLKKNEQGIIKLSQKIGADFKTFAKEDLIEFEKYYPGSDFVKERVGVANVAQAAAHKESGSRALTDRFSMGGVTLALGKYK